MKKMSPERPLVKARAESENLLWIITAMLAIFMLAVAAVVAWG